MSKQLIQRMTRRRELGKSESVVGGVVSKQGDGKHKATERESDEVWNYEQS